MFAIVLLLLVFCPYSESGSSVLPCSDTIEGCGSFVENRFLTICCECKERFGEGCELLLSVFCEFEGTGIECCPCALNSSLSTSGCGLEECAKRSDLTRILRLLGKADEISRRTIHRCGTPVTDECAGKKVLKELERLYGKIHILNQRIKADCFDSSSSSSSHS